MQIRTLIKIPLFFVLFLALGLSFGYLTYKILGYSRTVKVPSLTNMTLLEANEALSRAGLYLKVDGEAYDPIVQTGRILRQDIPPGRKAKTKRAIKVIISKGPRVYSVPYVVNETLDHAESILIQKGIKIGKVIEVHSDFIGKGKILAQRPEPDERLIDKMTVLVSLGHYEVSYYCPDFLDKSLEYAQGISEKLGILIETKGAGDIIMAQEPPPGALVKSGETVVLEMKELPVYERIFRYRRGMY